MNLAQSIKAITEYLDIDRNKFIAYMDEDNFGGWDEQQLIKDKTTRLGNHLWICGSIWEIEAKILYAVIRSLKPVNLIEFGSYHGCSTTHICEALLANGKGKLTCVDIARHYKPPAKYSKVLKQVSSDVFDYTFPKTPKVDFVFEDMMHTTEQVSYVWELFKKSAKKEAVIMSHDSEHYIVGPLVQNGIKQVTDAHLSLLTDPAKCGLAMWRKLNVAKKSVADGTIADEWH